MLCLGFTVLAALGLAVAATRAHSSSSGFVAGFDDDLAKRAGTQATDPMRRLGAQAERLTLQWAPGETALTSTDAAALDRAVAASSGLRVVLSVYGTSPSAAPTTPAAQGQYCAYVASVLRRYSAIRTVIVWNEPNKSQFWSPQLPAGTTPAAPVAYEALLATCYDALHRSFPGVDVLGFALAHNGSDNSGSTSPGAFIRAVGAAYKASGRTARIFDTVAYHPYPLTSGERPWLRHVGSTVIGEGDWNKLMYNLWLAFDGTAQPLPGQSGVSIWYTEWGVQSAVPASKSSLYSGTENVAVLPAWNGGEPDSPPPAATSTAPDQGTQVLDAIRLAACQPYVGAFFNFLVADEPTLAGWQSGPLYVDRTPKPSYPAFQQAIAAATSGSVDCAALKGGAPSADYMPPSTIIGLSGSVAGSPPVVTLRWQPASDNASAVSYRVYRGGALVATTAATTWSGSQTSGTSATYAVRAIDAAGNLGSASSVVTITA